VRKIIKKIIPRWVRHAAKYISILERDYGHIKSVKEMKCIDNNNNPLPWYTYPAIEYLEQLDLHEKTVFEYGIGYSTLFWSERVKDVYGVENNMDWFNEVNTKLDNENINVLLQTDMDNFIATINTWNKKFDIIIVDSEIEGDPGRVECAKAALSALKDDGAVILDNSDWYVDAARILRDSGMIQVDMSGFGPINDFTWTTSFFFKRKWTCHPKTQWQPAHGIGAKKYIRRDSKN